MSEGEKSDAVSASVWPVTFAVGVAVLLVGLIVNPEVIAPIGAAVSVVAAFGWIRGGTRDEQTSAKPERRPVAATQSERFPRSRFLERATLGLGGLIAAAVALPTAGVAILPAFLGQRRRPVGLGPLDAFPEGRFVIATFLADPAAGEVSRHAAYIRNNGFVNGVPSFTAMSSRCTHVGCPTQPNGPVFNQQHQTERTANGQVGLVPTLPAGGFGCPCHGSQFDMEGNRTAGPAARALDRYVFSVRRGHLWLDRLYSVSRVDGIGANARIHAFALRGPGEPASGPESLLYPLDPIR